MTPSARCRGAGIFLETSAHIERLFGSKSVRADVNELCKRFPQLATSVFVLAEFEAVIGEFYRYASILLLRLGDRRATFGELWDEVREILPYKYQGKSLSDTC